MSALRDAVVLHLQSDAPLMGLVSNRIYPGIPPEPGNGDFYPCITVTVQKGRTPERVFRGGGSVADTVALERELLLIKAIDQSTSNSDASDIGETIQAALDGVEITIANYTNLNTEWLTDISYSEQYDGQTFQHEGGVYEIWAKKN